jgi:hypothetical protein
MCLSFEKRFEFVPLGQNTKSHFVHFFAHFGATVSSDIKRFIPLRAHIKQVGAATVPSDVI